MIAAIKRNRSWYGLMIQSGWLTARVHPHPEAQWFTSGTVRPSKKLALPAKLPEPKIKPRKGDSDVKLKGYAEEPLKWIRPGELEMSNKLMGIGRDVGFRYTGSIVVTVAFDASGRASIKSATETKTEVSE